MIRFWIFFFLLTNLDAIIIDFFRISFENVC